MTQIRNFLKLSRNLWKSQFFKILRFCGIFLSKQRQNTKKVEEMAKNPVLPSNFRKPNGLDHSRLQFMHDKLQEDLSEIQSLDSIEPELKQLNIFKTNPKKSIKLQSVYFLTYHAMIKRKFDFSYFICTVCKDVFESAGKLIQHKLSNQCWHGKENLDIYKQKIFLCRICDRIFLDFFVIINHILTDLMLGGFSTPNANLDVSQCFTVIYIEQLQPLNLYSTLWKMEDILKNLGHSSTSDQTETIYHTVEVGEDPLEVKQEVFESIVISKTDAKEASEALVPLNRLKKRRRKR